ncbi:hypothetical protein [Streptomyces griseorubiginosus]|uniref:hypothetical protein n=1 Tax=Streptomyces griseorubiginosus TaxID=67304 RepID=UPI001AD6DEA8|nr:hypothetical protein [Streptomyces griseorubiginosus]
MPGPCPRGSSDPEDAVSPYPAGNPGTAAHASGRQQADGILGGIAIQTVVLAVLDAAGVRPRAPLTRLAASLQLVLESALVVVILAVVVMGTQLPPDLHAGPLAPASAAIAVLWLLGLVLLDRAGHGLPWREGGDAPDSRPEPRGHSRGKKEKAATDQGVGSGRAALIFASAALATLVAGVAIEHTGEEFFARQGLSGVLFGATVPATATSLPEISTGLTSTRLGDYQLAVSDIFGGNSFLPVLFLPAALISASRSSRRRTTPTSTSPLSA